MLFRSYYSNKHASAVGSIGNHVMILNTGSIKNVRIGDYCHICGTCRLSNGSVNSNVTAPVHIGHGVICDDFIISSGSKVDDGTMLTRCFVGQSCKLDTIIPLPILYSSVIVRERTVRHVLFLQVLSL